MGLLRADQGPRKNSSFSDGLGDDDLSELLANTKHVGGTLLLQRSKQGE